MSQTDFCNFLKNVGIREETAEKLWEGNIRSPQELASSKSAKLNELSDDSVLINTIHPVLQQYAFPITMASDPYQKALTLLRKHGGDSEPMETDSVPESLQSDASPFITPGYSDPSSNSRNVEPSIPSQQRNNRTTGTTKTTFSHTQNKPRNTKPAESNGDTRNIVISGGNFVQSSFLSDEPVTINNTNSTVQAYSFIDTSEAQLERRSAKVDPSWIKLEDCTFSTADLHMTSAPNYWPTTDTHVNTVDTRVAGERREDAYPVPQWNSNRALLINVTKFRDANERQGAEVDAYQLENVLKRLGFEVTKCINKSKSQIEQSLREFRSPARNNNTSISLVFIGSHGDRKNNEDWFIGSDNGQISASYVINQFNGSNCQALIGKPKIFFFQFCRKDNSQKRSAQNQHLQPQARGNVRADATVDIEENVVHFPAHDEADMLQAFATAAGTKAYRDTRDGSWFVTALCKVLKEDACRDDLLSMMTKVNNEVMTQQNQEQGEVAVQMAQFTSTLKKKVRFYPQ